ncbi:hypothetical protein [Alienimonas californiensis]|uniref:Uncharacterized protein n=1 Tax=Alienimonas californiensis TaxID=2527989 RepID=A0A517P743_9PLAN|nr:hypothetical protein [Alienimonas californiensis]QDT15201.1 hypothetical protein CA12_12820 [Alienimonas californiensis]
MNALTCVLLACLPAGPDQPPADPPAVDQLPVTRTPQDMTLLADPQDGPAAAARRDAFAALMTGATLDGRFSVDGSPDKLPEERYEIGQVSYVKDDLWTIAARIKYGANDVTVPVPVKVFWAGDTPVITLEETTLPGMGTFSARVLVHKTGSGQTRYAGTWQHDAKGGCLFGTVEPKEDDKE